MLGLGDRLLPFNVTIAPVPAGWVVGCGVTVPEDEVCWDVDEPWLWLLLPPPRPPLLR